MGLYYADYSILLFQLILCLRVLPCYYMHMLYFTAQFSPPHNCCTIVFFFFFQFKSWFITVHCIIVTWYNSVSHVAWKINSSSVLDQWQMDVHLSSPSGNLEFSALTHCWSVSESPLAWFVQSASVPTAPHLRWVVLRKVRQIRKPMLAAQNLRTEKVEFLSPYFQML